jgi:hypothetical protein
MFKTSTKSRKASTPEKGGLFSGSRLFPAIGITALLTAKTINRSEATGKGTTSKSKNANSRDSVRFDQQPPLTDNEYRERRSGFGGPAARIAIEAVRGTDNDTALANQDQVGVHNNSKTLYAYNEQIAQVLPLHAELPIPVETEDVHQQRIAA